MFLHFINPVGLGMKCQLRHPPKAFCYGGIQVKELEEMSDENFQKNIQAGRVPPNKNCLIKPPSPEQQNQAMVNERTQRYSRFSGLQVEQFEMNEVVCFYCGVSSTQRYQSKDNLFLQKLGPAGLQNFVSNSQRTICSHFGKGPYLSSLLDPLASWDQYTPKVVWKHGHEIHPMRVVWTQWQHKRSIRSFWLQMWWISSNSPCYPSSICFCCPKFERKYDIFALNLQYTLQGTNICRHSGRSW